MAVQRQFNLLSQERIDVPHLKAVESSIAADFDILAGKVQGGSYPLVVRGFTLANLGSISAPTLSMVTADGILFNVSATASGTFLWVPTDRAPETLDPSANPKVTGAFAANRVNYVGLDLVRSIDNTTTDRAAFLDLVTKTEDSKLVPLGTTLDYKIVITTVPFSIQTNLIPIAIITTNSSNIVTAAQDARPLMFRLGSGGDAPDSGNLFLWPQARQLESSALNNTLFTGGDKAVGSLKDWMNAVMTRLWEVGGGERWFSATSDKNVNMVWTGSAFTNGENFEWTGTNLHWKGLLFLFDNSTVSSEPVADQITDSAGLTDLADGDCVYVDLNRTSGASLTAAKAPLITMGPGSGQGARWILAWRNGANIYTRSWRYPVGTTFQPATTTSLGEVELNQTPANSLLPKVVAISTFGTVIIDSILSNGAGAGHTALTSTGGATSANSTVGGAGVQGIGGTSSGTTGQGGSGLQGLGGNGTSTSNGGYGVVGQGGTGPSGSTQQGHGGFFIGGAGSGLGSQGGNGLIAQGAGGTFGGIGGIFTDLGNATIGGDEAQAALVAQSGSGHGAVFMANASGLSKYAVYAKDHVGAQNVPVILSHGYINVDSAPPAATDNIKNLLTIKNIVKMWGNISLQSNTFTVVDGVGINSCGNSAPTIDVRFVQNMANTNYEVELAMGRPTYTGLGGIRFGQVLEPYVAGKNVAYVTIGFRTSAELHLAYTSRGTTPFAGGDIVTEATSGAKAVVKADGSWNVVTTVAAGFIRVELLTSTGFLGGLGLSSSSGTATSTAVGTLSGLWPTHPGLIDPFNNDPFTGAAAFAGETLYVSVMGQQA